MNQVNDKRFLSRFCLLLVFQALILLLSESSAAFPFQTTRSEAMGGAGTPFPDDASVAFSNPAAVAESDALSFYSDFSNENIREVKAAAVIPLEISRLAIFWARRDCGRNTSEFFAAGAARKIFEGAPDTYIEIGADVRLARAASDTDTECEACGLTRVSDSDITGTLAIVVRPFPVISFRLVGSNIPEMRKLEDDSCVDWSKSAIFGATLYLRDRVFVSWEREYRDGSDIDRYGFSVKTASPIELMAGYSEGSVYGGGRMNLGFLSVSLSFSPGSNGDINNRISFELVPGAN